MAIRDNLISTKEEEKIIDIIELNEFFTKTWANPKAMSILKEQAEFYELGSQDCREFLNLRVVKLSISKPTNFDLNQEILITPQGYHRSQSPRNDGKVKFGRHTQDNNCDISFHAEDLEVSRNHFTIHFDNKKWYVQDEGSSNGTSFRLSQGTPLVLKKHQIVDFGEGYAAVIEECVNGPGSQPDPSKHFILNIDKNKIQKLGQEKAQTEQDILQIQNISPEYEQKNIQDARVYGNMPRLRLKFDPASEGAVEKKEYQLFPKQGQAESIFLVGRSDNADIKIQGSSISRKQARIIYDVNYGWLLDDGDKEKKSTNGTFVWLNKSFQKGKNSFPFDLYDGLVITVCGTHFQVKIEQRTWPSRRDVLWIREQLKRRQIMRESTEEEKKEMIAQEEKVLEQIEKESIYQSSSFYSNQILAPKIINEEIIFRTNQNHTETVTFLSSSSENEEEEGFGLVDVESEDEENENNEDSIDQQ